MTFVKFVILYDVIIGFLVMLYRLYLRGLSPKEKIEYKLKPATKVCKLLSSMLLFAWFLSLLALLIFLVHVMF